MIELSPLSRTWIYQSNPELKPEQATSIREKLAAFRSNWISHGSLLKSWGDVVYNHFIVLMVDESDDRTCGSAVDASVNFVKALENELGIMLLDRMRMAYRDENGNIKSVDKDTFENLLSKGIIHDNTVVFNNLVQTRAAFETEWEIPFAKSWHAKLFRV